MPIEITDDRALQYSHRARIWDVIVPAMKGGE